MPLARTRSSDARQLGYALKWTIPWVLLMGALIVVLYWFVGYAEVEVVHLRSTLQSTVVDPSQFCALQNGEPVCTSFNRWIKCAPSSAPPFCRACRAVLTLFLLLFFSLRVDPVTYIIALVNVLGWIVLIVFGGVGLAALPVELIQGFIHRPKRLSLQQYTKQKALIHQRAVILLREGDRINKEKLAAKQQRFGFKKRREISTATQALKKEVLLLERDYKQLEFANNIQGSNVLWEYTKFVFGLLGIVISFCWVLHFILYLLPISVGADPIAPFLNGLFEALQKAPFVGPLFYGIFAFYMLMAVLKGNIKVGFRIVFITLYPMELHDTLMNALLFNVGLFLTGSLAVAQLCAVAFSLYARFTASASIFLVQISNLRGIRYIFIVYVFLVLAFFLMACIWLAFRRYKREVKLKQPEKSKA